MPADGESPKNQLSPDYLTSRIAALSPAKRALFELELKKKSARARGEATIRRRPNQESSPLSFAQQRLWFMNQLEPASPIYNESRAIRLRGSLDVESLQKSLDRIVARHDVLRTNFIALDGNPQQTITDSRAVELPVIDLRSCRGIDRESEAHRLLTDVIRRPFDLSRDLLLRVLLLRLAEEEHILLFVQHHIASDGWSTSIFWRELTALYEAFTSGRPDPLSELPIQYADYALWQRDRLSGETLESQLAYWIKQLENLAPLQLTPDRARPGAHDYAGDRQTFLIPQEVTDGLRRLSRDEGVTLFMTLLAAFQTLLHRYTGQNDIAVGSPIAGRTHPEVEGLIGFFVNTLVLRAEVSGHLTFRQFLARVREVAWGAYQHQELPFEKLVAELQPDRDLGRNPLFQVIFAFQNVPRQTMALPGLEVSQVEVDSGTTKFDLALFMWEEHEGLRGRVQYSTALFDADTIERLLGHFETMLLGIVTDPDHRLSDLPLLTEREKHQSLVEWNNTATAYPNDARIHELFEEQVEKSPEAIAVVFEKEQLSYRELNERANQLANHLSKAGVGRETLVSICIERSTALIVGLLGILKAGGTYVPLDPVYPKERLAFMLEDTRTPVLLTQERFIEDRGLKIEDSDFRSLRPRSGQASIMDPRLKVICLDRDRENIAHESMENPSNGGTAEDLAYVMYTSGSTGQPKGVEIPHRGVSRLLFGGTYARLDAEQTLLQLAPISFDASTFEIWGALLRGGKCVLYSGRVPSAGEVGDLIHKHKVTTLWLTASLFNALIDEAPATLSEIKQLLIGGEVLSVSHVRRGLALLPHTEIINGYGPTESTTFACCYSIPKHLEETAGPIPIGRPIGNTQVYVLDRDLNPSPVGVPGEIYIGGDGLARGYLNQPELTAEQFIPNPFAERPGARLYKTGDLARYSRDGNIEFLGRMDNQVKIRGYRIELGEIESVLIQHPTVHEAVVLVREEGAAGDPSTEVTPSAPEGLSTGYSTSLRTGKQLIAYVVAGQDSIPSTHELRSFISQKLPEYMVPSGFVVLNSLPLMPNGKLDRKALPGLDPSCVDGQIVYVAPRTAPEKTLALIWAKVLGVERVGIHDNFFDLGGHSLLAVRLFAQIEKVSGKNLPLSTLFRAPTVEQLAVFLSEEKPASRWSSLFPIQTKGSKFPFFWVHGEASDAFVPRYLGSDQPVYGLRHQSEDGSPALYKSVDKIAAHYLDEIRMVQPNGPYHIGGYCFGGMVAFEMAQQLKKQHQEIALLVLLEPSNPANWKFSTSHDGHLPRPKNSAPIGKEIQRHWQNLTTVRTKDKSIYLLHRSSGKIIDTAVTLFRPVKRLLQPLIWHLYLALGYPIPPSLRSPYTLNVYHKAMKNYVPKVYRGRLTLFARKEHFRAVHAWKMLTVGDVDILEIPGNHQNVLIEPHMRVWAEELKSSLQTTQNR
jgi:amino acid adenylation domain-containing protein